jgi:hypothetical protein
MRPPTGVHSAAVFILIQGEIDKRGGDTMILDSVAGHRKTMAALSAFLDSTEPSIEIAAAGPCHMCPDSPRLRAFRMVKSDGRIRTAELPGGILQVSGRPELLARYIDDFKFVDGEDGDHRHPENFLASAGDVEPGSQSIIIEVDNYADDPARWEADNRDDPA